MKSESVVIYRSQFEADADAFWHDNPQYVIYFFAAILGLFLIMMIYKKFQEKNRKFWKKLLTSGLVGGKVFPRWNSTLLFNLRLVRLVVMVIVQILDMLPKVFWNAALSVSKYMVVIPLSIFNEINWLLSFLSIVYHLDSICVYWLDKIWLQIICGEKSLKKSRTQPCFLEIISKNKALTTGPCMMYLLETHI